MVSEIFVKQLDGCTFHTGGDNCTCAAMAMWLYRASGGRIKVSSCDVRRLTGDKSGGTNLEEMEAVAHHYGITGGRIYKPIAFQTIADYVESGRYGAILQIDYSLIAKSQFDCFHDGFFGGHGVYLSRQGPSTTTIHGGDPGADGRFASTPKGYQDYPESLLEKAASGLVIGTQNGRPLTVGGKYGFGKCFAFLTPQDKVVGSPPLSPRYHAIVTRPTSLWNPGSGKWVYGDVAGPADNRIRPGVPLICRSASYNMGPGKVPCYPVDSTSPNYPGYFIPKANVRLGTKV